MPANGAYYYALLQSHNLTLESACFQKSIWLYSEICFTKPQVTLLENCHGQEWQKLTVCQEFGDKECYEPAWKMLCSTVEQQALGVWDPKTVKHRFAAEVK